MKRVIVTVALVAAVLGVLALRVVIEGRRALAAGDAALADGHHADAIRAYESAARWYFPLGTPHVDAAYRALRELASSKDPATSLAAWRAIRSAARATRSLWTPHADDLAAADAAIATISAGIPQAGTADPAWHRERLARDVRPSTTMAVLASLGILLWIGGAIVLVRRGFDPAGAVIRRIAGVTGGAIVVGLALWAVGLYNA